MAIYFQLLLVNEDSFLFLKAIHLFVYFEVKYMIKLNSLRLVQLMFILGLTIFCSGNGALKLELKITHFLKLLIYLMDFAALRLNCNLVCLI